MDHIEPGEQSFDSILDQQAEDDRIAEEKAKKERERIAFIQKWIDRMKFGRKHDDEYRKRWADDRRMARGDSEHPVTANLIGSIMEVLASFLYAKNPDISIKPSDSVNRERIGDYRKIAETLQIVVSRLMVDAGLKRLAKKWVRAAMTVGISWMKIALHTRKEPNVLVEEEINDLQQQIRRLDALEVKAEDEDETEQDTTRAEIDAQLLALESQREIDVAEGAVIDIMSPEDVIIAPECGDVENYIQSPWIGIDLYKTMDQAREITGWKDRKRLDILKTATMFRQRPRDGDSNKDGTAGNHGKWIMSEAEETEAPDGFLRFTEIWSKTDGVVFTIIEGIHEHWGREPYSPITGKRWYPIFDLPCHQIDGERYPQGDVFQLKHLQDEYGRIRSNKRVHRQRAVPGIVFDKNSVEPDSVLALTSSEIGEYTGIELTTAGQDIRTVFVEKKYNPVDPNLYETRDITTEMEKISGAQDALQSSVQVEKTATEARIEEAGFASRSGARRDILEDSLTEAYTYLSQIALQIFTQADAIRYAGPEAVWIEMSTEEALMLFNLTIKAGSTGKPKVNSDREIWGTLLPLIEGMIDRIGQARIMGQEWAAKPWIALLDETMQRLDDPSELEKFLPVPPPPQPEDNDQEPTEAEKAEIEKDKSSAVKDRAIVIEKVPELFTKEQAQLFLLFGGQPQAQPEQQPQQSAEPQLDEAPNPLDA